MIQKEVLGYFIWLWTRIAPAELNFILKANESLSLTHKRALKGDAMALILQRCNFACHMTETFSQ